MLHEEQRPGSRAIARFRLGKKVGAGVQVNERAFAIGDGQAAAFGPRWGEYTSTR